MTAISLADRVAARPRVTVDVDALVRFLLSVLAAPFFGLGWLVGGLVSAVLWVVAAVALGFDSGRGRGDRS